MGIEIERKFLVVGEAWKAWPARLLSQGYLSRDPARTVRVRIDGEQAFLTVKGRSVGASRAEFEYPIPVDDAMAMLSLCEGPRVEKLRRVIPHAGMQWEVDEFLGENAGLVVAEVELLHLGQHVERPDWLGEEVTEDARYFNSALASHPYKAW